MGARLGRRDANLARTSHAAEINYDALVIACGALPRPSLAGALTFRGPPTPTRSGGCSPRPRAASIRSIAFIVPAPGSCRSPVRARALTATHLDRRHEQVELTLVTPEPAPLALFGDAASEAVRALLSSHGVALRTGRYATRYEAGRLELDPAATLLAERVVALPRLEGQRILGIPQDSDGFIATDLSGRVPGFTNIYAAGDITQFPIKQGGIAAQQADAVAEVIAGRRAPQSSRAASNRCSAGFSLTGAPRATCAASRMGLRGPAASLPAMLSGGRRARSSAAISRPPSSPGTAVSRSNRRPIGAERSKSTSIYQ